jgi:dihydrofolate synthase/folylpolyglutamate synthase
MDAEAAHEGLAGPTYFEMTTAIALMHFAAYRTDYTILEVGLGGRLDSTNVCQPAVSVITNISFDHTRQLGNSLTSIAREKAGIIKSPVPVVSGVVTDEPRKVIQEVAAAKGCSLVALGRDFDVEYHPPDQLESGRSRIDYFHLNPGNRKQILSSELATVGRHQAANAAIALAVAEQLNRQGAYLDQESMCRGLAAARCPARVEIVQTQPTVVLDAAHNVASVEALCQALNDAASSHPRQLILAMTRGKDINGMLHHLVRHFDSMICTCYRNNPRCQDPAKVASRARELAEREHQRIDIMVVPDPASAWKQAMESTPANGLICVTGSFFIAAEIGQLARAVGPVCP